MSAAHHVPLWRRTRFGVSLAMGAVLLAACGGNPASAPGQGAANLPPQTNPGIKDPNADKTKTEGPKQTLKGTIVNAVTGEPVEKALLFVEGVVTTVATTPIPSAPPPGPDDKPGGGAEGGPAPVMGGMQVAQLPDPNDPRFGQIGSPPPSPFGSPDPFASPVPSGSPNPFASPVPSGSPGASPSPGSSPVAGASTAPGAAAATTAPTTPTASGSEGPTPLGTPLPLTTVKPDSKGKFELKDLPAGAAYSITVWAPGYQGQTFQGNLPTDLDVKLRPLDVPAHDLHTLKGVVRSANNQPAGNAEIEISSLPGKFPGEHANSDDAGAFSMTDLVSGNYSLAGWTTNLEGEVTTFAMVKEVPVSLGREKRTVSPTLVLRAVTSPMLLAGTVGTGKPPDPTNKKQLKPQAVRAFINSGDGEIPIANTTVGKDGYFRLRLPPLPEGATYHLVASGVGEDGRTSYVHKYNVAVADPKLEIPLPDAPTTIAVTNPAKAASFSWEPAGSDVTAYRVAIESVGQDGDTLWEGWTSGTAIRLPSSKDLNLLHDGESYRYTLTAIRVADKGKLDLPALALQNWESSGMTKPATFEVQKLKPGQKPGSETLKPLSVPEGGGTTSAPDSDASTSASAKPSAKPSKKPSPKPSAKPSAKPSGKPSPKSPRAKPITNI